MRGAHVLVFVRGAIAAALVSGGLAAQSPVPTYTYDGLLGRLATSDWLWSAATLDERCRQWSSFDPASRRGPGDASAWYANDDRGKHVRVVAGADGPEHVMVDAKGPGCVARIWSANPSGTLHFDVDGARAWSIDFGALCRGEVAGVPAPLAGMRARGGNCALPIPFERSLVVSCTAGDCYYAFDVVQWPAGTNVPSFTPALLAEHGDRLRATAAALAAGPLPVARFADAAPTVAVDVPPATIVRALDVRLRPKPQAAVTATLQPKTVLAPVRAVAPLLRLVVRCGDETTVDVPLPALFAAGPDWTSWEGRHLAVHEDGATLRWPMPMPDGGRIEVVGDAAVLTAVDVWVTALHEPLPPSGSAPLRFRAGYHLAKAVPTRPFSDHLVLDARGAGRFVGCSLLVRNPTRIWWGEGDEKFTVDGESFPSWFGTGTEDYFGYAWCDPTPFAAPFHAQVQCDGPANFGFTVLHRSHQLDSVPFGASCRFDLERWHWVETATIDYETVAYWYGAAGATAGLPSVPAADERLLPRLAGPKVFVAEGALEGEALRVIVCSGGTHEVQDLSFVENTFSRDAQRWWRDGAVGDRLVLAVPVAQAGRHRLTLALTKADDFGAVKVELGGAVVAERFDGYAPRVSTSGPLDLGVFDLPAGDVELVFTLLGRNGKAKPRHMVGVDYVQLERLP
ncbi:MAG: DUF2961 domain-containing protein [Phycisphaerales bacterium]|nr:DUF2961 domain-containing protein [Phycisphaerales bacterium]